VARASHHLRDERGRHSRHHENGKNTQPGEARDRRPRRRADGALPEPRATAARSTAGFSIPIRSNASQRSMPGALTHEFHLEQTHAPRIARSGEGVRSA
jgi:hypothetical protein